MRQPVGRPGAFSSRHRALSGRQFDHIALDRRPAAEFRPCGHQPAALLDHVGALGDGACVEIRVNIRYKRESDYLL